jgi:translation initiation factor IF-3
MAGREACYLSTERGYGGARASRASRPFFRFDGRYALCYIRKASSYAIRRTAISTTKELRVNDRIKVREVRVIGDDGEQLGVLPILDALRMARERDLDLVEVAPNAVPPVCRLLEYGKFKYEQAKKEREARKNQRIVLLKEVRLRPGTDDHDIDVKCKAIQRFLEDGDKVKVTIRFKGREMAHPQLGKDALDRIANNLKDIATVERAALVEGRTMTMIVGPGAQLKAAALVQATTAASGTTS